MAEPRCAAVVPTIDGCDRTVPRAVRGIRCRSTIAARSEPRRQRGGDRAHAPRILPTSRSCGDLFGATRVHDSLSLGEGLQVQPRGQSTHCRTERTHHGGDATFTGECRRTPSPALLTLQERSPSGAHAVLLYAPATPQRQRRCGLGQPSRIVSIGVGCHLTRTQRTMPS
jgi:hypothetical protein